MEHLDKFVYDETSYGFVEAFRKIFATEDLSSLHKYLPSFENCSFPHDSFHILYKIYYGNYDRVFRPIYQKFLKEEIFPKFKESFYFQDIPLTRFGLPKSKWLSRFHKDGEYHHPSCEHNFNLAITKCSGSAALQIEDKPSSGQYNSVEMIPGSLYTLTT